MTLSLVSVIRPLLEGSRGPRVYELSSRGAFVRFLRGAGVDLTVSEFFEDVPRGEWRNGIQCQDVMALTHADGAFDLCTSTEVFEHVPDDLRGFREMLRVLRPGGYLAFTVPMAEGPTVVRAVAGPEGPTHLLRPEYHGDRIRGAGRVLCYRTYGPDILDTLRAAGFESAKLVQPPSGWLGYRRPVVIARKAAGHAPAGARG
ncbi:hypothetical protein BWI17_06375 [Betaproteobacteria bacterium GR16-43]|nr:hypothetical protein BWI17_06375 [Betaproteobacteria bacterium GR16-43]